MSLHANHQPTFGKTREIILTVLEEHPGEELTTCDISRLSGVPFSTCKNYLQQYRKQGLVHGRRAVTLFMRPTVWSRYALWP